MPQPNTQNATATAADFLTRCFSSAETIALLLRHEFPTVTTQRIVQLETALAPRYLAWLARENAAGANVYVAANPLRSDSRKRTKECIVAVRHLYLDLDTDGEDRLTSLRASDAVPPPNAILSTSPGKYQILWRVDGFTLEQQESALKLLAITFGGDPACTDCNRVFRLDILAADAIHSYGAITARKHSSDHSNSEHDWAWVLHELARGKDAVKLTRKLASRRADKPNPLYYAQRTVDVASARLWLIEGIPIDDVVTLLEVRRRFEIPIALCRARAREIAQTAQRMIARRKIA